MRLQKIILYTGIAASILLFIAGSSIIFYIKSTGVKSVKVSTDSGNTTSGAGDGNILKSYISGNQPFNILILGSDKASGNSDTMMLVNFDPDTYKLSIMSILRDTKVIVNGEYHKINFAFLQGDVEMSAQTVSELLDINIKYYVVVDIAAFRKTIDLLGGVDIYVPADMDYDDPEQDLHIHLKKGLQHLDGEHAEQYVRFRKPNTWTAESKKYYAASDLNRVEAQQNLIRELAEQKANIRYLGSLNNIISVIFDNVETNLTLNDIFKLAGYIGKFSVDKIYFLTLPGVSMDKSPWYYFCSVEQARGLTAQYFQCGDSFVNVDEKAKDTYINDPNIRENPETEGSGETKDMTEGNPSNADSSLDGGLTPDP